MNKVCTRKIVNQNLMQGEQILREFKNELPYLRSNTKINLDIARVKDKAIYQNLLPKLRGKSILAGFKVSTIRRKYHPSKNKVDFLVSEMKREKAGNCAECAVVVNAKCAEKGLKSQNVKLDIVNTVDGNLNRNHSFTLVGFDEKADISNPHTWGKDAVIVDGWANIAQKAQNGVEYLKQLFAYDSSKETCTFRLYKDVI